MAKESLSRENVVDLLYYLGASKVINHENKDDIQYIDRQFKKNTYVDFGEYLKVYDKDQSFLLSKEDEWILNYRYCGIFSDSYGAKYVQLKILGKRVFLHNALMKPKDGQVVDHKNGNTLDNRRLNLRTCSLQDNSKNRKTYTSNRLGVRGVSFNKKEQKYIARIQVDKKPIFLGYFDTLEQASEVRQNAEIKYFGKFRRV